MLAALSFRSITAQPNTANNPKSQEKFMVQIAACRNFLVKIFIATKRALVAYIVEFL